MATNERGSYTGKVAFVTGAGSGVFLCMKYEIPLMLKQGVARS